MPTNDENRPTKFLRGHINAAKLTPDDVYELRRLYAEESWTQGRLSRHFRISVGQVGRIVRGESWQQYTQPVHRDQVEHEVSAGPQYIPSEEEIQASLARLEEINKAEEETGESAVDFFLKQRMKLDGSASIDERAATDSPAPASGQPTGGGDESTGGDELAQQPPRGV